MPRRAEPQGAANGPMKRSPLLRFLGYVRPHAWLIAGAAVSGVLKFVLPLIFPLFLKYLCDVVLGRDVHAAGETTNLWLGRWCEHLVHLFPWLGSGMRGHLDAIGLTFAAVTAVLAVVSFFRSYLAGKAGHRLIFDLRYALYQHIQTMSHSFFDERRSGAIVARFVSDIQLAQNFVGSALTNVWMDGFSLGFVIWILFVLQPRLAWVAIVVLPLYIGLIRYFSPRIKAASREVQEMTADLSGELHEKIAAISVVKAFGREPQEARRFHRTSRNLFDMTMRNVTLSAANQAATGWITTAAPLAVVWVAGWMVLDGGLTVGTLIAFYAYLGSLYLPLQRFSELSVVVSNSLAAIERIFEFFDIAPEVYDRPDAIDLRRARGRVEFRRACFAYPRGGAARLALRDVDLRIEPGEVIAIVGRSGAGKSTFVSLIPRFYDVQSGAVSIDGHDVRDLRLRSLREQIGIVLQDPVLFSGTLRENLLYGRPEASNRELKAAAHAANADEFIDDLPDGYMTLIGERGVRLSGGQRQRIAIARTFLKNPPILILDEATSALDSESENLIHDALRRLMRGRTAFIIAHRLSTVVSADRIVVLQNGAIAEIGQHDELLLAGGLYAQLYEEQFRVFGDRLPQARRAAGEPA